MGKDIARVEVWTRLTPLSKNAEQYDYDQQRWKELIVVLDALAVEFSDIEMSIR